MCTILVTTVLLATVLYSSWTARCAHGQCLNCTIKQHSITGYIRTITTTTNNYDFARIIKPMRWLDNILITWPCTPFISFVLVRRHLNIPLWNSRSLLIKWLVYYFHTFNSFVPFLGLGPLGSLNHNNFISLCVCMINYIFYFK